LYVKLVAEVEGKLQ